jgi:MFS family permease
MEAAVTARAAPRIGPYRYVVVALLAVAYMFNFLDRQLLTILAESVKEDLALSDTQLGLLTGLTFALFYTVFGIPIAAYADRANRVRVIAASVGVWSLFTAGSGLAVNFVTLALARMGVGVGEAGCSPPSYSIISDYFEPEKRGRALALYTLGVPAGSLVGILVGGWLAAHFGWRNAFIACGAAGFILAPLIAFFVREPVRGAKDAAVAAMQSGSASGAFAYFFRSPTLIISAIATGLMAFVSYGILNWTPAFLGRVQHMPLEQIAATYSLELFIAMLIAAWLGAAIADKFGARRPALNALLPGLGLLCVIPFLFGFTSASDWRISLALLFVPLVLTTTYLIPALALIQNRTPPQWRATVSALVLFVLNLIGLGLGPLFVGVMSDHLQPTHGADALGVALQWLTPFIVAAFLAQCAVAWTVRSVRGGQND